MFNASEDFFTSIGLFEMTDDFKTKTVNNQTKHGKPMECHASAEDFCLGANSTDFRIKMCTEVNMADLVTVHHEMGHIEYFMAYRNLSFPFREAANPGIYITIGYVEGRFHCRPVKDFFHSFFKSSPAVFISVNEKDYRKGTGFLN